MAGNDAVVPGIAPRDWDVDGFFADELHPSAQNPETRCRLSRFSTLAGPGGTWIPGPDTAVLSFKNPLEDPSAARDVEISRGSPDAGIDWRYWIYAPPALRASPPASPKLTLFFGPPGPVMNRQGLRAFFEGSDHVLVAVAGTERSPRFGVGISPAILDALLTQVMGRNLGRGRWTVDVLAAYSTGYRGMNGTINAALEDAHLGAVSRLVYFDCLYSHDQPSPGENTFRAMSRVLERSPGAKLAIYEITGDTGDAQRGGTPRRRDGGYFTRFPPGADPRDPAGSALTTVSDLKPHRAALLTLALARLVQGGLEDGYFDRAFLAATLGPDGAALAALVDERLEPRGRYASSREMAARTGATFVGSWVSPAEARRFAALAARMQKPVLDNPKFALLGWVGLPSLADLVHDTHVPELGWEHLPGG